MPVLKTVFGNWMPDAMDMDNPGLTVCQNTIRKTPQSYGPVLMPLETGDALADACLGAYSAIGGDGTIFNFAGDSANLYLFNASTGAWTDVSGATYAVAQTDLWKFTQFGQIVLATQIGDVVQAWTLGTSAAFAALAGTPPQAKYIAVWEPGFVVLGWLDDGSERPQRIRWSAFNNAVSWPTIASSAAAAVQSDQNDFAEGGQVQAITGPVGGAVGAVFCETAIYRAEYTGPPTIFRFVPIQGGLLAPHAWAALDGLIYYIDYRRIFCAFDGSRSVPIGNSVVDAELSSLLDLTYPRRIIACADVDNRVVYFAFPDGGGDTDRFNTVFAYHTPTQSWSLISDDSIIGEFIFVYRASTLFTDDGAAYFGTSNVDAVTGFTDDPALRGGSRSLANFSTNNKLAPWAGNTMAATFATGSFDGGMNKRMFVTGLRLIYEANGTPAWTGQLIATPLVNPAGLGGLTTATTAGAADGWSPQRKATRYVGAHIVVPSSNVNWSAMGVEARVRQEGRR